MMAGQINIRQAKDYADEIDRIKDGFLKLPDEDRMDAPEVMGKKLNHHMSNQFDSMKAVDVNIIMGCIKDPKCIYMWWVFHKVTRSHPGDNSLFQMKTYLLNKNSAPGHQPKV